MPGINGGLRQDTLALRVTRMQPKKWWHLYQAPGLDSNKTIHFCYWNPHCFFLPPLLLSTDLFQLPAVYVLHITTTATTATSRDQKMAPPVCPLASPVYNCSNLIAINQVSVVPSPETAREVVTNTRNSKYAPNLLPLTASIAADLLTPTLAYLKISEK